MLRIAVHDDGKVCRLELAGRLEGPWVDETENTWRALSRRDCEIEVDLRQLTAVDDAGRDLLAAIQRTGVCLIVEGIWMTALIGELNSRQPREDAMPQSRSKKHSGRTIRRQQENSR